MKNRPNLLSRRGFLASAGFLPALPGWKYEFPRDHFSHPEFRTEWWYYTGNLHTGNATASRRHFGFELTFFRQAISEQPSSSSIWATRDIWMAHLALTDTQGQRFFHAERLNRQGPGLAGVDAKKERIWNGNWTVHLKPEVHELRAVDSRFRISLNLLPAKPPVIQGEGGLSKKGPQPGQASLYISFTRLAASGEISLDGQTHAVRGSAWMDHEIFSSELDPQLAGWDWFSIQLDNNTELMLYRLRQKDGSSSPFSAGSFIDAQARVTHLTQKDFQLTPGRRWKDYPVEWQLAVPSLNIRLNAQPRLDAQELLSATGLTPSYWEGAMIFTGSHSGQGYLEMTGYDKALRFLDIPSTSPSAASSPPAKGYEKLGVK
jgi:predicted secreted hydrolase